MQKQRRVVGIYQTWNTIYVLSQSTTKEYKILAELPLEKMSMEVSPETIGMSVRSALIKCRLEVDQPGTKVDELAKEFGTKDWKDLVKKSLYCSVTDREDGGEAMVVNVCKKSGAYGFDYTGEQFAVDQENVNEIGSLVKKALALYKRK